jgi:hypothetical protein
MAVIEPFESDRRAEQERTGRKYLPLDSQKELVRRWVAAGHTLKEIEQVTKWRRAIVFHGQP